MTETVLIVAKAPSAGRSKTRLVPPLTPEQAAELQGALLLDTLDACRAVVPDPALLVADPQDIAAVRALAGAETRVLSQDGAGLADALRLAVARHVPSGPVALVSSDLPGLPEGALRRAFAELERGADVVLGPALDGGYWLLAMRAFAEAPFTEIPWSTPAALAVTLERCRAAGLRTALLEPWRDIDTFADVAALATATPTAATRTRAVLDALQVAHAPHGVAPALAASALLASSPWRSVLVDRLVSGDGTEREYTYLAVPRAVFVAALTDEDELLLVRQYRHPVREWTLEVPAGSALETESALEAATRELAEETGGRARSWEHLSTFYSSSAHLSLRSDAFLATGVAVGAAAPEADEEVSLVRLPWPEAVARARAGGFVEGQTALTILLAAARLASTATHEERRDHAWPSSA